MIHLPGLSRGQQSPPCSPPQPVSASGAYWLHWGHFSATFPHCHQPQLLPGVLLLEASDQQGAAAHRFHHCPGNKAEILLLTSAADTRGWQSRSDSSRVQHSPIQPSYFIQVAKSYNEERAMQAAPAKSELGVWRRNTQEPQQASPGIPVSNGARCRQEPLQLVLSPCWG